MKDQRDIETSYDVTGFVAELRRLADALEANGSFTIELDGEMVEVPADALFSVEHEREDGRGELEFQLKWGVDEDEDDEEEDEDEDEDDGEDEDAAPEADKA